MSVLWINCAVATIRDILRRHISDEGMVPSLSFDGNPMDFQYLGRRITETQKSMNLQSVMRPANYLTIARILLIPFFMLSFRYERMLPGLVIFCVAAITDYLDGVIARKQGTTSFGKFMDPLADKLLVGAALICLTRFKGGLIPGWMVLIIMGREVVITTLRLVFVGRYGTVVAASRWGKYKTSSQMVVIIASLVLLVCQEYSRLLNIDVDFVIQLPGPIYFMMYVPLVLTVISGFEFLYNNRKGLYELMRSPDTYTDDDI